MRTETEVITKITMENSNIYNYPDVVKGFGDNTESFIVIQNYYDEGTKIHINKRHITEIATKKEVSNVNGEYLFKVFTY